MTEAEMANVEPTAVMLIAAAVFFLTVIGAMILQVMAFKHKREHGSAYMLKDSLFRHKELVYTEEGMKYINWQKRLAMGCTVIIACLLLLDRFVI